MKKFFISIFIATIFLSACSSSDDSGATSEDGFDRKAMLENLADHIIIPSYQNFATDMTALKSATSNFMTTTNEENLLALRASWSKAYISWQTVSMYAIGKAEELEFREFMNIFPVSTEDIKVNIANRDYNLEGSSKQNDQGFAALDYLLNGLSETDSGILASYTNSDEGDNYRDYLDALVNRMDNLTNQVVADWENGYRDTFVNNSGSSLTSSVDKIVNDFILHYEKYLRSGKIGIPAGAFVGQPLDDKVEAFYAQDFSKTLFNKNLDAMQDFFNGKHFGSNTRGESFRTYFNFLNTIRDGEDLVKLINDQFEAIRNSASALDENFSSQIKSNNQLMIDTFTELQKNVIFFKVDMLQAFSVSIDFQDTDGD